MKTDIPIAKHAVYTSRACCQACRTIIFGERRDNFNDAEASLRDAMTAAGWWYSLDAFGNLHHVLCDKCVPL